MNTWVEPLRAAANYAKHGWHIDPRQMVARHNELKKVDAKARMLRLLDCMDGRMTAEQISNKSSEAMDYTRKTLNAFIKQEKVARDDSTLPFLYWRV